MRKVEMLYYSTNPSETNTGMKSVLWKVVDKREIATYDWGYCEWLGTSWRPLENVPEGYTAKVVWWANTLNPNVLLGKPTKIIKL